jgi:ribosome-associated protein
VSLLQSVKISGEYITLAQMLKKIDLISSGGQAKDFLLTQKVEVNGVKEERRGRKLYRGDLLTVDGQSYQLV